MILKLLPEFRDYVWGGQVLRPGQLTAEAWVVFENNRVAEGPHAGATLGELAAQMGADLIGPDGMAQSGGRFPLLIKLLDCASWLSVQVHPNDEQAVQLEGPGKWGKTEAWHILSAEPGSQLIAGIKPGTTKAMLSTAIQDNNLLDYLERQVVQPGDTVFMPAGTIHALGPGLLVYEVQQTSDITYRVFDWNRPATPGRQLHIPQSLAVANPTLSGQIHHLPTLASDDTQTLTSCAYFQLDLLALENQKMIGSTEGRSFHALTVISGNVEITNGTERTLLNTYETALLPASSGTYQVIPGAPTRILRSSLSKK